MSHARIEEVSDSGTEPEPDDSDQDSDPDIEDIDTLVPAARPSTTANPQAFQRPVTTSRPDPGFDANTAKRWVCLYPLYFDASRSRAEGRRVAKKLAVENPLARTMADACAQVGLRVFIDVGKTHPKDWANPGRVKVELKDEHGGLKRSTVQNKHHLHIHIASYLQSHPTTPETPFKLVIRGMPVPEKAPPPPIAPRGWKVNPILPLHSPAVTGGGVSEDLLKDMMGQMGGQLPPGMLGAAGGAGAGNPPKKMKRKIIRA